MPCYSPIDGYRGPGGRLVAVKGKSLAGVPLKVPCGQCIGCRLDKVRDWGTRIAHEAQMHDENIFVTLTYSDEYLPDNYSLNVRDHQLFMKRLRKKLDPLKLRYYSCGEYGDKNGRPHYHQILFGYRPSDAVLWRVTENGHKYFRSQLLEETWGMGHVEFGDVTAQNGAYVAGYALKKMKGAIAKDHYQRVNPLTGELVVVEPEFALMSSNPGIGSGWFEKYETDAFPSDFVVIDGKKRPVPSYYKRKLKDRFQHPGSDPDRLIPIDDAKLRADRALNFAKGKEEHTTPERLAVREELAHLKQKNYTRNFDSET